MMFVSQNQKINKSTQRKGNVGIKLKSLKKNMKKTTNQGQNENGKSY